MCRMLIAIGNVNMNSLIEGTLLMANDKNRIHELNKKKGQGSWKHQDGWGVAYLDQKNEWKIEKSIRSLNKDSKINKFREIKTNLAIIHIRKKMGSETSLVNTHPFLKEIKKKGQFVFCHNGWIEDEIKYSSKFDPEGDTDSERLFYSILTDLKKTKIENSIRKNFKRYKKLNGTNIIFASKDSSHIAIRTNKFPKYYQMYLGKKEDLIVISSEEFPLRDVKWQPLEQEDIVNINNKDLTYSINKLLHKKQKDIKIEEGL